MSLILMVCIVIFYFFPTIIAYTRQVDAGWGLVALLNVLIGWTMIGWVVCLIWAAFAKTAAEMKFYSR